MKPELEDLRNEVLKKVGRNVVLFQEFEVMLKFLVTYGKISGYACDLEEIKEKHKTKVMKTTLGQVAGQFIENAVGEYQKVDEDLPELKEKVAYVSFSFRIQSDEKFYLKTKENIANIIQQRNDLIHHLSLNFDLNTIESLKEAEKYLDEQREAILPEHDRVKQYLKVLDECRKELVKYINSGELMRKWKLDDLRHEYVVKLLGRVIELAKRDDGWTLVAHAGRLLQQNAPDQLKEVKKKYKCKTLKDLILKTEIFDLEDEPTPNGGRRAVYRIKDGWRLETHPANEISF